jgi:putative SOS response-associated peptidase YedK
MCGRLTIPDPREQQRRFGFVDFHETRPLPAMPRCNVAPSQMVPVVVEDAEARRLRGMAWGFLPAWMRDAGKCPRPINVWAETLPPIWGGVRTDAPPRAGGCVAAGGRLGDGSPRAVVRGR